MTCDVAGGAQTTRIGQGPSGPPFADNITVTVNPGASFNVTNDNSISLRDNNTITLAPGSVVTTTSSNGPGRYGTGNNTIEFNAGNTLTISAGASVIAAGTQSNSEAINPYGPGNRITNFGTIQGGAGSALFFENINTTSASPRNVIDNYGTIQDVRNGQVAPDPNGEAIGSFHDVGLDFINRTGAKVIGNLNLQGGEDNVTLETGSVITGALNGGSGLPNHLFLQASAGASDNLPGAVNNFNTLDKTGAGTWTLTGAIGNTSGALAVKVAEGVLVLTGNNTNFNGNVEIDPGATLEARAQSLPPVINDLGGDLLINQVSPDGIQPNDGTYAGTIQGSGVVTKIGVGTVTLTGINTYSGGTFLNEGAIAVGADSALGAATGGLTFNGGALKLTNSFDLAATRPIVLNGPQVNTPPVPNSLGGGTIDANGFHTAIAQGITGAGNFTVTDTSGTGAGLVILNAVNPFTGSTSVVAGTLAVGDAAHPSANLSGGGPVSVAAGATLGGYGSVAGNVTSQGTVAAADALPAFSGGPTGVFTIGGNFQNEGTARLEGSSIGNVLSVQGDYGTGGGSGVLQIKTLLNLGGPLSNQSTDRLLIFGNASGGTSVQVNAIGPGANTTPNAPSADHGISIIQVAGASSVGAFTLSGGYVTGGTPYQYQLYAFGPGAPNGPASASQSLVGAGNWDYRLESLYESPSGPVDPSGPPGGRPAVAPQVPSYITLPTALFNAGFQDLDGLHRRLGEIRDDEARGNGAGVAQGEVFIRAYGAALNYRSDRSFEDYGYKSTQDYAATQFGGNWIAYNDPNGTLRVGLAGVVGQLWFQPNALDGSSNGQFTTDTLAGALTWQSRAGWYVDAIVAGGKFGGNILTMVRGEATGMRGNSVAASLEAGYPIPLGWEGLSFEPQVQFVYQHLNFAQRTDVDGIAVNLGNQDQGVFRGGARLTKQFAAPDGTLFTPYLKANVLQGIGGGQAVNLGGAPFLTGHFGTSLQVGGGLAGTVARNLSIYGDVAWQDGVGSSGTRGWAGNAGLRYAF